jgi:hypothetical protein
MTMEKQILKKKSNLQYTLLYSLPYRIIDMCLSTRFEGGIPNGKRTRSLKLFRYRTSSHLRDFATESKTTPTRNK